MQFVNCPSDPTELKFAYRVASRDRLWLARCLRLLPAASIYPTGCFVSVVNYGQQNATNNGRKPPQTPQPPKPPKPCYSGNSFRDREVRFFSLVRLGQTWEEWLLGYSGKLGLFGVLKAGAEAAGGPGTQVVTISKTAAETAAGAESSLGSATITTGAKGLGLAGSALMIDATAADLSCIMEIDEHGLPVH